MTRPFTSSRTLKADPNNAKAYALQSVIAAVQNRKDEALDLAKKRRLPRPAVVGGPDRPILRPAGALRSQRGHGERPGGREA